MARGFAGMSVERRREIASQGGQAAHAQGRAHVFDTTEAAKAGAKGRQARGYGKVIRLADAIEEDLLD